MKSNDITDILVEYRLQQPYKYEILIDDNWALMTMKSFMELVEYSTSLTTGTIVGKMWKALRRDGWVLKWYRVDEDPGMICIETRPILLV